MRRYEKSILNKGTPPKNAYVPKLSLERTNTYQKEELEYIQG